MNIEIADPKFKHGQRVFFLREEATQHGIQHRCTECDQIHYAERYMPIVTEGIIAGCTNWNLSICSGTEEPHVKGPFYQIDGVARGTTRYGADEAKIFATYDEAMAARRPTESP